MTLPGSRRSIAKSSSRVSRVLLALATVLSLALWYGAGTVPAQAAGPSGATQSVTVFLKAPDAAGLRALAAQPVTDRAQRLRQLDALLPGAGQRQTVVDDLQARGFSVVGQTSWSVTATAPASLVTSVFGTRATASAHPTAAELRAATGALPAIPASLAGLVSGVYPTTGGPAAFHHQTTGALTGPDIRNADAAAGVAPSTGTHDSSLTIATLQLSNWDQADLTHYATNHGFPDPVASGQYQAVQVDGGPGNDFSGDVEVDLDQQSLLSTAPSARQQAYFAPNTEAGFNDVFSHVLDDVTGSSLATNINPHIAAMSVSWGECEAFTGAASIATTEPILESLVAAGVTIFSSSGDDGIYDCRGNGVNNSQADVDYPASSPAAVGVGGTRLSAASSAPNTGSNWTETSWSCTSPITCETTTGGTGGGVSGSANGGGANQGDFTGFARPAYQAAVTNAPFAAATTRMVPDIAADGDPNTGFVIYTSDPGFVIQCGGNNCQFGGTSLAAPLSAAQFANTLGDAGRAYGVGDIHAALYKAYTDSAGLLATNPAKVFRDVTVGTNGANANKGTDPSVSAGAGYDTNTGLGAVLWPAFAPYLPASISRGGTIGATATAKLARTGKKHHKHQVVSFTWSTTPPANTAITTSVTITKNGATKFATSAGSGAKQFKARAGKTYVITVTAIDVFGDQTVKTAQVKVKKPKHHHHH